MLTIEEQRLKEIIDKSLDAHSRIDGKLHREHHMFIAEFIEEKRVKRERYESVKRQVLGWGIIAAVGTLGTLAAHKFGIDL